MAHATHAQVVEGHATTTPALPGPSKSLHAPQLDQTRQPRPQIEAACQQHSKIGSRCGISLGKATTRDFAAVALSSSESRDWAHGDGCACDEPGMGEWPSAHSLGLHTLADGMHEHPRW